MIINYNKLLTLSIIQKIAKRKSPTQRVRPEKHKGKEARITQAQESKDPCGDESVAQMSLP